MQDRYTQGIQFLYIEILKKTEGCQRIIRILIVKFEGAWYVKLILNFT